MGLSGLGGFGGSGGLGFLGFRGFRVEDLEGLVASKWRIDRERTRKEHQEGRPGLV